MDDPNNPYAAAHRSPKGPGDARPTALQILKDNDVISGLPDLVILITGCSSGLGVETARALAATGATLYLTARNLTKAREALGAELVSNPKIHLLQLDLDSLASVRSCARTFLEQSSQLNILVTNAGILNLAPIEDYPLEEFDRMVATNVRGTFVAMQAAARVMKEGGRIVTIGSIASIRVAFPTSSVYSMTKGAVAALVRGAAIDLAPRGITVNNVQPGPTATDMTPGEGDIADKVRPLIPLGRLGSAEETASLVAYLAGPQSSFITGASLTIDGGYLA